MNVMRIIACVLALASITLFEKGLLIRKKDKVLGGTLCSIGFYIALLAFCLCRVAAFYL